MKKLIDKMVDQAIALSQEKEALGQENDEFHTLLSGDSTNLVVAMHLILQ